MTYDRDRKIFEFIEAEEQFIIAPTARFDELQNDQEWNLVGPAIKMSLSRSISEDIVESVWCPQWPNEAKNWPIRRRKYDWPTTSIIHEIVQNGCHVVYAKHPACRNDIFQCRLSFSVAEVILLQSWTPKQQIVYHMLRFFAKTELIKKDCPKEDEVLCTYHFKTLMLWSCEEKSPEWWNSLSVINICCNLLQELANWLEGKRCRNYFTPEANLFHESMKRKTVDETVETLMIFGYFPLLCRWFEKYYIQPISPDNEGTSVILRSLNEYMKATESKAIDFYVSTLFGWEVLSARLSVTRGFETTFIECVKHALRSRSLDEDKLEIRPWAEIESCFGFYGSMLRILHAVRLLDCKEMNYDSEWFVEVIRQVSIKPNIFRSKHHNLPRPLNTGDNRSQLHFIKAQDLMENLNGSNHDPEFKAVSEISKVLLRKALECEDSKTRYLTICSTERTGQASGLENISQTPTFPLDAILMTIADRKFSRISKKGKNVLRVYQRIDPINKLEAPNEDDIIQLLMEYSLQNLNSFSNAICKDYGIHCNTVDCYRAVYMYKFRKYPEVLHLCEEILHQPDVRRELEEFTFRNVALLPPLDSYFDREVQCLLAFLGFVYYLFPINQDLLETEIYFLGKHFLAGYLKVRCLIDCNHSLSEVMFEFKKLKACLPLEVAICCFLEQKLGNFRKALMKTVV